MGWHHFLHLAETTFGGNILVVYDQNRKFRNTVVGAYAHRWMACGRIYTGLFPVLKHVNILFVRHSDEMEYVHQLDDWFLKGVDTGT